MEGATQPVGGVHQPRCARRHSSRLVHLRAARERGETGSPRRSVVTRRREQSEAAREAEAMGLAVSPMERLLNLRDADARVKDAVPLRFLDEQRRMHPEIAAYPNYAYYGGRVRDSGTVLQRPRPSWLDIALAPLLNGARPRTLLDVRRGAMRREGTRAPA